MKRSSEAFWWSLFSAGGVMSALFLPVLVLVTGLILPAQAVERGRIAYDDVLRIVSWWPVRLVLAGVICLSFFHAAHRIRHILIDLGVRGAPRFLSVVCYGGAVVGSGFAVWILAMLG